MALRWPADPDHIGRAIARLHEGAVIAFPTDTVYAVGARAQDPSAVRRLYAVKRRPADQPVVLLVDEPAQVRNWAVVSPRAEELMRHYWPGPLTLVLARRSGGPIVGAAGPTVAFRAPDHPVALALIRGLGEPIASSSANWAGAPPPTNADGVMASLEHEVDLVLDGGESQLGEPSTILDLSGDVPRILRPGVIPESELVEQA
jgi:L-threonylcarbamoyladenylate synthase